MTMAYMTTYKPGNVVMVRIRFTDSEGIKKRPAVILTDSDYHDSREDAIVVALTSSPHAMANTYYGDYVLSDWRAAHLPQPSKAKGVIQTIERATIERIFGSLTDGDLRNLKDCIRTTLGLDV